MTQINNVEALAPYLFWILDHEFNVISHNQSASGTEQLFTHLRQSDIKRLKNAITNPTTKQEIIFEWLGQSGKCWLSWKTRKVNNQYYVYASDVTELKERVESLNQILNAIPDLILVKGKGSRLQWANNSFLNYYNMSIEELKDLIDAPYVEPDITNQYVKDDMWVWENKKSLLIESEPIVRHDGVTRQFQTLKSPILDRNGNCKLSVGISRDITEKIEYQERSLAASKMAALGEMAGSIAHEINNPLSIILGKSQLLMRQKEKNIVDPDTVFQAIQAIESHSLRIAKIIDGLRYFCHGPQDTVIEKISVKRLINDTLSFCMARLNDLNITVHKDDSKDFIFEGRFVQLSQILLNLLNNAIDAVADVNGPWIKIEVTSRDQFLELRVMDAGKGVSPEVESKIMESFFTTKSLGKGTGLGLSISQALAASHGGSLKLDRQTSPSCFLLTLPFKQN